MARIVRNLDESIVSSKKHTYSIVDDKDELLRVRCNTHYFSTIEIKDKEELRELIEFLKKVESDILNLECE